MTDTLQFKDKALAEIVQKSAFRFANFQKELDEATVDIRSLEKWLQSCGMCIPATTVGKDGILLSWEQVKGNWRLMCVRELEHEETGPELDIRPLVETPALVRLSARPYLATLVSKLAENLPITDAPEKPTTSKMKPAAGVKSPVNKISSIQSDKDSDLEPFGFDDEMPF